MLEDREVRALGEANEKEKQNSYYNWEMFSLELEYHLFCFVLLLIINWIIIPSADTS
jgi:hypothetical protein